MSSQEDEYGATLGPGENEQVQQPFPGATWGGAENKQVQQPDSDSTTQISDNQGVANPPLPSTPQASGNQGVVNIPPSSPPMKPNQQQKPSSFKQKFVTFVDRFNFVLVPLVFAILILFFTILFAIRNHVFLPPLALAMLLLALGLMQGTLLYYIDKSKNQASKEMYWNLTVILGFALFLVVGTLALFGFGASVFFLILLLLGSVFVATRAIHRVPEGSIDITTLFDKYIRTLQPGPHLLWPLEKSKRLSTKEKNWESPLLEVKIAPDENDVYYDFHLKAKLKYQLDSDSDKAHNAKLNVKDWETSLQEVFVSALKNVFREVTPEEVKSWQKAAQAQPAGASYRTGSTPRTLEEITNTIKDLVQRQVVDWGVKVRKVDIQDETLIINLAPRPNPTRPVAGAPIGTGSLSLQQAPPTTNLPVDQQPTIQFQPYPAPEYPPHSESEIETLKDSYEAVRLGRVTDPDTIRMLAARFAEHVYDPNLDFYPLRAAEILYSRARYFEELKMQKRRTTGTVPVPGGNADVDAKDETSGKIYNFY
jgi:regulator of protease activity HflC (stomatin/prohibitin superfamily)